MLEIRLRVEADRGPYTHVCWLLAVMLVTAAPACAQVSDAVPQYGEIDRSSETISLAALIANPSHFDGKQIRTFGVIHFEFEGNALYLSKEHWQHRITPNGVWVEGSIPNVSYEELQELNGKYVLVEGRVNAARKGHFDLWTATLEQVNRVALYE